VGKFIAVVSIARSLQSSTAELLWTNFSFGSGSMPRRKALGRSLSIVGIGLFR
jgi:hypothetical protein